MPAVSKIRVKGVDGLLRAELTGEESGFFSYSFMRRVNCPGAFAILINRRADEPIGSFMIRTAIFELDSQVEFYRRWPEMGIDWYLEYEGLMRGRTYYITTDGDLVCEISGRGYLDLINRRIVEAAAGSADAEKTGAAETVCKDYVTAQAGSGAGARALTGLSVEADGATGETVTIKASNKNLLTTCQDIAKVGGGDFDIIGTGAATFEFRWYDGQRGTDRSSTVKFSYELGNMGTPNIAVMRQDEISAVLVGGQGAGADREMVWRTDATRIADSTWNRIEKFLDQRNEDDTDGLNNAGDEALEEGRPKNALTFTALQTPGCLLGKHYFFGDLVTASFMGYTATKKVAEYTITVNGDNVGAESILVTLEDV